MAETSTREAESSTEPISGPRPFTLKQRISLSLVSWAGYWFIRLIGPTLRVSVSIEDGGVKTIADRPLIASFWHSCIIPSAYIFRRFGIRVMTSASYDGEYIARIIRRFGYEAVRGSSSRNAATALLGMRRALAEGWTVAFTLDGPRGPRHQVKPGPVALGRSTGLPLVAFHVSVDKAVVLNSWDRMVIPLPFARVLVRVGKLISVPLNCPNQDFARSMEELQAALDRVSAFSEENVRKVGSDEFPYYKRSAERELSDRATG